MLVPFITLLIDIISIYFYVVIAWGIMSMLISFNIINRHQTVVSRIFEVLERLVEPVLQPIRKYVPPIGGLDIAPIILFLGLKFLQSALYHWMLVPAV